MMEQQTAFDDLEVVEGEDVSPALPVVVPEASKPAWVLKKLTARHKRICALKMSGLAREDIATTCQCTPEYISMLMKQPLIVEYMGGLMKDVDDDLKHLTGQAVDTVRTMMGSGDDKVALSAAQTVLKANGKLGGKSDEGEGATAEDVVAKLFAIHSSNVQINITPKV